MATLKQKIGIIKKNCSSLEREINQKIKDFKKVNPVECLYLKYDGGKSRVSLDVLCEVDVIKKSSIG